MIFQKKKKQKEEAVASSSLLVPKPKSKDDDGDSTGSGETTFDDTLSMTAHKEQLTGWGIKEPTLERISFSGSKGKLDVLNKIAKFLYQEKDSKGELKYKGNLIGIEYLNLVTKAGKKVADKRPLKSKEQLSNIYAELIKAEPATVGSTAKAKGGQKK